MPALQTITTISPIRSDAELAQAQAVTFDDITMRVQLTDGRTVSVPLR